MAWYKTGNVAVTLGSTTVNAVNTKFAANARVGDAFRGPDGRWYEVVNIASDVVLSIFPAYIGPSNNNTADWMIAPIQGYNRDSADKLRAITDSFPTLLDGKQNSNVNLSALASLQGVADRIPYFTGAGALSLAVLTAKARAFLARTNDVGQREELGLGTVAVENIVPFTKGGTGVSDNRPVFSEIGVRSAAAKYNVQGLYAGWNASGLGEGHFIVNRGNGDGGFNWRSVNVDNTAGGPSMTYSYAGTLTVPTSVVTPYANIGILTVSNEVNTPIAARGYRSRNGVGGSYGSTSYNFNWTGSNVDVYIDATYVGTMTLFGSDYRFKKSIKNAPKTSYLDRIDAYRIVTYQRKALGDVFKADTVVYQGLIAHEAQAVNPLAVTGEKDGLGEDGNIRVQQLEPMALITDLMGAVKELRAELEALKLSMKEVNNG